MSGHCSDTPAVIKRQIETLSALQRTNIKSYKMHIYVMHLKLVSSFISSPLLCIVYNSREQPVKE